MDLFWVDGSLAVASRPRGGDWLDDEMADVERQGIDLIVSCLTPLEEAELGLEDEPEAASRRGIAFLRIPMDDRGTPASTAKVDEVVREMSEHRASGGHVAVHCRQGLGRAPLVVAAALVRSGMEPEDAWSLIAERRDKPVPDTEEQRQWIRSFAERGPSPRN
jgi:protein-tyrosine phosphatase